SSGVITTPVIPGKPPLLLQNFNQSKFPHGETCTCPSCIGKAAMEAVAPKSEKIVHGFVHAHNHADTCYCRSCCDTNARAHGNDTQHTKADQGTFSSFVDAMTELEDKDSGKVISLAEKSRE